MIAQGDKEKSDSSLSNHDVGVYISDILEEISYLGSGPSAITCPILLVDSCLITCIDKQSFAEEGENCASTISMVHLGLLFLILGASLTLFGSMLEFQGLSIMFVTDLINFGVKNQAPQVSFRCTT